MGLRENKFLHKKGIEPARIMYMTRDGRKTVLHLDDGRKEETFNTIKGIMEELPADRFECINKGVIINVGYLAETKENSFRMTDGACFQGRVRMKVAQREMLAQHETIPTPNWQGLAVLDNLPIAFCIIELVFDENGHGLDFIFRYCNKAMEPLEGKSISEMVNHSFYEVFTNGDKKWLVTYADVALNGTTKTIESYSPEVDATLRITCYQPKPNFCACMLQKIKAP